MRRLLRPLVLVVASSTSMGLGVMASDLLRPTSGASGAGQLGELVAQVAADRQFCAVPFPTCTTPAPSLVRCGHPHAAAQLGASKPGCRTINGTSTLTNAIPATDSASTLLDKTLHNWEAATKLADPNMTPAPKQFVQILRPLHTGHEIAALLELRGTVRAAVLKSRYTWTIQTQTPQSIVLSAVPNDLTERLFVPRLEVSLDRSCFRPTAVSFEARKSTGPLLAKRVEVALDQVTAMPTASRLVAGGAPGSTVQTHRVARPDASGVILASATKEAATTRDQPRLLSTSSPHDLQGENRVQRLEQILNSWSKANSRRAPSAGTITVDPSLPAHGVRHAALSHEEMPLNLASCSGSELTAQYEWRLLYEADEFIWLAAVAKPNAKQNVRGMTVILQKETWLPVCEHRRLADGQTETIQAAGYSVNEPTAATSRPRLLPPAPRD